MVIKTPKRPIRFQQVVAFLELLISTGWCIHGVVDFNTLQIVDFNRLSAEHANLIDHTGAAAKQPPLFCPLHWHVQPQPFEINNLQPVEINNSMNATTC